MGPGNGVAAFVEAAERRSIGMRSKSKDWVTNSFVRLTPAVPPVKRWPEAFPDVSQRLRGALLRRFTYSVYYTVTPNTSATARRR